MLVGDVAVDAHTTRLWDTIADAAETMKMNSTGCLVVVDEDRICGVLTERDIAIGCPVEGHIPWECHVYQHMTIQTETAHPGMDTASATIMMMDRDTDHLPVVRGNTLVGLVRSEDIFSATERQSAYESDLVLTAGAD